MNDYGAINEAMSDIQGNVCDLMYVDEGEGEEADWLVGEDIGNGIRSMSDPHRFQQPEYTWDLHFVPEVRDPTELNDRGGVHSNSSLLNNLAWRLCEKGGMTLEQARAYWFTVDCSMVPGTDYPELANLLPWALKMSSPPPSGAGMKPTTSQYPIRRAAVIHTRVFQFVFTKIKAPNIPAKPMRASTLA
jgi:Zn-dependent metalloprotease